MLLDFVQPGDTLVVTRIDRLARSMNDLQDIVHELNGRGVALRATEQPLDTRTAAGKAFLDVLGVFADRREKARSRGFEVCVLQLAASQEKSVICHALLYAIPRNV